MPGRRAQAISATELDKPSPEFCFGNALRLAFRHVERSAAKSRHLAADGACLSFAARFLPSGPFDYAQGRLFGLWSALGVP